MRTGDRLAGLSLAAGVLAAALLPLSYAWLVPVLLGSEDEGWSVAITVVAEVGALLSGGVAVVGGLVVRFRTPAGTDRRRGGIASLLGGAVIVLAVGLNVLLGVMLR